MGLIAKRYRTAGEGPESVCIVNIEGPFEPDDETPAVMLVEGNVPDSAKIVPAYRMRRVTINLREGGTSEGTEYCPRYEDGKVGPMWGGSFVHTSDSRFAEAVEILTGTKSGLAVPLHDRFETPAQYEALST
jgi:hypothetical protein